MGLSAGLAAEVVTAKGRAPALLLTAAVLMQRSLCLLLLTRFVVSAGLHSRCCLSIQLFQQTLLLLLFVFARQTLLEQFLMPYILLQLAPEVHVLILAVGALLSSQQVCA